MRIINENEKRISDVDENGGTGYGNKGYNRIFTARMTSSAHRPVAFSTEYLHWAQFVAFRRNKFSIA